MADTSSNLTTLQKLQKIQRELKAPKNQYNKFGNYNYRNVEDIQEALKPLLEKYEAAVILSDSIEKLDGSLFLTTTAIFMSGKEEITVKAVALHAEEKKGMDSAQLSGSISSYCRKYALGGMFLIDDNKDADSQAPVDTKKNVPTAKTAANPPANSSAPSASQQISADQIKLMYATMREKGYTDGEEVKNILHNFGQVESIKDLTKSGATALLKRLKDVDKATLDGYK